MYTVLGEEQIQARIQCCVEVVEERKSKCNSDISRLLRQRQLAAEENDEAELRVDNYDRLFRN